MNIKFTLVLNLLQGLLRNEDSSSRTQSYAMDVWSSVTVPETVVTDIPVIHAKEDIQLFACPVTLRLTTMVGKDLLMSSERVSGLRDRGFNSKTVLEFPPNSKALLEGILPSESTLQPLIFHSQTNLWKEHWAFTGIWKGTTLDFVLILKPSQQHVVVYCPPWPHCLILQGSLH